MKSTKKLRKSEGRFCQHHLTTDNRKYIIESLHENFRVELDAINIFLRLKLSMKRRRGNTIKNITESFVTLTFCCHFSEEYRPVLEAEEVGVCLKSRRQKLRRLKENDNSKGKGCKLLDRSYLHCCCSRYEVRTNDVTTFSDAIVVLVATSLDVIHSTNQSQHELLCRRSSDRRSQNLSRLARTCENTCLLTSFARFGDDCNRF